MYIMIAYIAYADNSSIKKVVSFILDGWHKSCKTVCKWNLEISSLQTILPAFEKAKKCFDTHWTADHRSATNQYAERCLSIILS